MKTHEKATLARRSQRPMWCWVALAALTQMGMAARGCHDGGGDDGSDNGGTAGNSTGGSGGGNGSGTGGTGGGCNVNGRQRSVGEIFPSSDGCNSCSCGLSGDVACTERACPQACGGVTEPACGGGGTGGRGTGGSGTGGSGGSGTGGTASGDHQCGSDADCPQPPCACLDQDGDNQCDNHCPSYGCREGQCVDTSPQPVICGGLLGTGCADGEFCKFAFGARCGAADATGECTVKSQYCTDQYDPVCGCDGNTYGNSCYAESAGVSTASRGECGSSGTLGVGDSCGGHVPAGSPTCGDGLFCQHQPGALCGAADAPGECVAIPASCSPEGDPVCGCNGVTYANACNAARARVGILDLGRCN